MTWADAEQATQLINVTTEQFFDVAPALDPAVVARCEVAVTFSDAPIDDATVRVYGTFDGEEWDTVPTEEFVVERIAGLTSRFSFVVREIVQFRIGVRSAGVLPSADFSYRSSGG